MSDLLFIFRDIKFSIKKQKLGLMITWIVFLVLFLGPLYASLLQAQLPIETQKTVLNASFPLMALSMAIYMALIVTTILEEEKNDKVIEHIFNSPLSVLKFIRLRFISFAITAVILVSLTTLVIYATVAFLGLVDSFSLLIMWFTASISVLPIVYTVFIMVLLLSPKYVGWVRSIIISVLFVIPVTMFSSITGTEATAVSVTVLTVSFSAVLGLVGLLVTLLKRDQLLERIILST